MNEKIWHHAIYHCSDRIWIVKYRTLEKLIKDQNSFSAWTLKGIISGGKIIMNTKE